MLPNATEPQTITITNFSGRLTRLINGDLNSGFAKFTTSWGYDPFSKPLNLTWLESPNNITGPITDLPLAAKARFESNIQYIYMVGSTGNLYKIDPNPIFGSASILTADSVVGISSVKNGTAFNYGASMDFFGLPSKIFVGHDNGVNSINYDGTSETKLGNSSYFVAGVPRILKQFIGKELFGNGPTFGTIDSTGTVTSSIIGTGVRTNIQQIYSEINPTFGPEITVQDLDITPDLNYAAVTGSETPGENMLSIASDRTAAASSNGYVFQWNGVDAAATAGIAIPSFAVTALQTYLQNNFLFSDDSFGASMSNGIEKLITMPGNKSPFPNATGVNGNFIFWIAPEVTNTNTQRGASLYYFGSLDQENPPGLYRLMRYAPFPKFTYQAPLNIITNNQYQTVNNSASSVATVSFGKHYFSTLDVSPGISSTLQLRSFYVTPTGYGIPQQGVYETQTQLFSKKIIIKQIRVYTEPTIAGNAFNIFLTGSDGTRLNQDILGYTYAAGTDMTLLQGSLDRINFNPVMDGTYGLGVNINNLGTTNMTIKKVELDWEYSGV